MKKRYRFLPFFLILIFSLLTFLPIPTVYAPPSVSYDPANNLITWSGTVNASYLYEMDKAGTLSLHDRDGITSTDGDYVACDYEMRPTDEVLMGYPKADLYITVSNWVNMTQASIRVKGTDANGDAQTDIRTFFSEGTQVIIELFKTLTDTQVVIFTGTGSFDYELIQGQWGEIWKTGEGNNVQYRFDCRVQGTNWVTSWWIDTDVQIFFSDISVTGTYQNHIYLRNYNYLRFGQLDDDTEKRTSKGVSFVSNSSYAGTRAIYGTSSTSQIFLYSTSISFIQIDTPIRFIHNLGSGKIYNCELQNCYLLKGEWTIYNLIIHGDAYALYSLGTSTIEGLTVYDTTYRVFQIYGSDSMTIYNLKTRNNPMLGLMRETTVDSYLIDCDIDDWSFQWYLLPNGSLYRQYSLDLSLTYSNGTFINGTETNTRVVIQHYGEGGGNDYNAILGGDGSIPTQTLSKGFYNRSGGDTIYSYEPYNLQVYNATGFNVYSKNFSLNEKINWEIALTDIGLAEEYFSIGVGGGFILGGLICLVLGIVIAKKRV